MEPGREDREHPERASDEVLAYLVLQWNPAVKTGSTGPTTNHRPTPYPLQWNPAVKTGST